MAIDNPLPGDARISDGYRKPIVVETLPPSRKGNTFFQ